jgi:hypothetical protein
MSTTVTTTRNVLNANGVTPLPFTFQALSEDEVGVRRNGAEVTIGFTVELTGAGTGTVTPTSSWGTDEIELYSKPSYQNPHAFQRFTPFYPDMLNAPLDRLTRAILALKTGVNFLLSLPRDLVDFAGMYVAIDADGNAIPAAGTGADAALRVDMAAAAGTGSLLIKHKNGKATSYARSMAQQSRFRAFDDDSNVMHYIHPDYDDELIARTNTEDLRTYIQNGLNEGMERLFFPGAMKYRVASSLEMDHGQALCGPTRPGNLNLRKAGVQDLRDAIIEFRPGAADTCIINKPDAATDFDGEAAAVHDIVIDLDRNDCWAIAFKDSYSNAIERVGLRGTYEIGVYLDNNYVSRISDLSVNDASVKRAHVWVGTQNQTTIERVHTSGTYPNDSAIQLVGIALKSGLGACIRDCLFQGLTLGMDIYGAQSTTIINPYFENSLSWLRAGIDGGVTFPTTLKVIGGTYEPVMVTHPQYADRGPGFYFAAGYNLSLDNVRFAATHAADAGFWPIVLGGFGASYTMQMANMHANASHILNEIARTGAHNWAISHQGPIETTLDNGDTGILMKASNDYDANHQIVTSATDGTITSSTNWQPPATATVGGVLAQPFYTPPAIP